MPKNATEDRALGVLDGVFDPEARTFVTRNGTTYRANGIPSINRRHLKDPERFKKLRYHLAYPRTVRGDLQFVIVGSPTEPERQKELAREAGQFTISGVVTNQRSKRDQVVVRVARNTPGPPDKKRQTQYRPHLLFLKGRVAPAKEFVNSHCTFRCTIDARGDALRIRRVESKKTVHAQRMSAGGIDWPWPFTASKASIETLKRFNAPDEKSFLVLPPVDDALTPGLDLLDQLIDLRRQGQQSPEEAQTTDRLGLIAKRIRSYTARMGLWELTDLLQATGLHSLLRRIELTASAPAPTSPPAPVSVTPVKKMTKTFSAATQQSYLDTKWQPLADLLLQGMPDAILRDEVGSATLKRGVEHLAKSGWFDRLSPVEQKIASSSYQMKKALKNSAS